MSAQSKQSQQRGTKVQTRGLLHSEPHSRAQVNPNRCSGSMLKGATDSYSRVAHHKKTLERQIVFLIFSAWLDFFFQREIISFCSVRAIIKDPNHRSLLLWSWTVYKITSKSAACRIYLVTILNDLCFLCIANRHIKGWLELLNKGHFFLFSRELKCATLDNGRHFSCF